MAKMSASIFHIFRQATKAINRRTYLNTGNNVPIYHFKQFRLLSNVSRPIESSNEENNSKITDQQNNNEAQSKNVHDQQNNNEPQSKNMHDSGQSFSDFKILPAIQDRLKQLGYSKPFEIQAKSLDHTLNDRNVIGRAITGSGKTLAFAIPIIQKVYTGEPRSRPNCPKAILIAPTRELCNQIFDTVKEISPSVRCVALYGGASFSRQVAEISRGVDVICATPGRLNDHIMRETLHLTDVKFVCLDEADELLNDNFKDQLENVLEYSPKDKQMMLFSATIPRDIIHLIQRHMPDPEFIDITRGQKYQIPENIQHVHINDVRKHHLPILCSLLEKHNPERCIVFLRTKANTKSVCQVIRSVLPRNFRSDFINSDLSQSRRELVLQRFRKGQLNILCATDVAARGLDIPEVDLIIQVEPPQSSETYIHRSGRTGRAGRSGLNIIIHSESQIDRNMLSEIKDKVPLQQWDVPEDVEEKFEILNKEMYNQLLSYESSAPLEKQKKSSNKPFRNEYSNYSGRSPYRRNQFHNRHREDGRETNFESSFNRNQSYNRYKKDHRRTNMDDDDEW